MAIYLITNHKKGISSVQLSKDIGVTQKSAWFMLHRLRHANKAKSFEFQGTVEADECYVGGGESNKHTKDKFKSEPTVGISQKAVVFGLVNRETKQVKSFNVENADKENLLPKIGCNVELGQMLLPTATTHTTTLKITTNTMLLNTVLASMLELTQEHQ